jgi:hypothetical protein
MSPYDQTNAPNYFNNVHQNNNILGNEYLKSITKEMNPIIELSRKITDKVAMLKVTEDMNEGFHNNNDLNITNKFIKFIIFIIIILIIFTILYNICK